MKLVRVIFFILIACCIISCESEIATPKITNEYADGWIWQKVELPTSDIESGRTETNQDISVRFNGKFLEAV